VRCLGMGLTPTNDACGAGPDASGNLLTRDRHSTPVRSRATERHRASRSLRRSVVRGRLTATHPCRDTQHGLGAAPARLDCPWPVMDSHEVVAPGAKRLHALRLSLLAPFGRSVRKGTPRYRLVEYCSKTMSPAG
jgi:hypothetical protein